MLGKLSLILWLGRAYAYEYKDFSDCEDKKGDLGSADNYRPIAITCILLKSLSL